MAVESRHVSVYVDQPVARVYEFVSDPANLPQWAGGLSGSIEQVGGQWIAESPMGQIIVEFAAPNVLGVLDHWVTAPSGDRFYNPVRVIEADEGSEVIFTVRRFAGVDANQYETDVATVTKDLQTLKGLLEAG